jgi:hypothetical protein
MSVQTDDYLGLICESVDRFLPHLQPIDSMALWHQCSVIHQRGKADGQQPDPTESLKKFRAFLLNHPEKYGCDLFGRWSVRAAISKNSGFSEMGAVKA